MISCYQMRKTDKLTAELVALVAEGDWLQQEAKKQLGGIGWVKT